MGLIRRSRTERPPEHDGRVTERDLEILTTVGRQKIATTDQLATAYFGDRSTASRRLARLVAMGHLRVEVPAQNGSNIYLLTKRSLALLVREGVEEESLHLGRMPGVEHLEHLRALGDFHAMLRAELGAHEGVELLLVLFEHDLRRLAGAQVPRYIPDLIVRLRSGPRVIAYAVEIDLGGEGADFFARSKVRETVSLARARQPLFGLDRWRPLVVAPARTRLARLATAIAAESGGGLWLGTDFQALQSGGVLGRSFASITTVAALARGAEIPFGESLLALGP